MDMRRILIGLLFIISLACSKEKTTNSIGELFSVNISVNDGNQTKSYFDSNENLNWSQQDALGIFVDGLQYNQNFTFTGENNFAGSFVVRGTSVTKVDYFAYYPYVNTPYSETSVVNGILPSSQTAPFDSRADYVFGVLKEPYDESNMPTLSFNLNNHLFSIVKINIKNTNPAYKDDKILGYELKSVDGNILSGYFYFDTADGKLCSASFSSAPMASYDNVAVNYPEGSEPVLGENKIHSVYAVVKSGDAGKVKLIVKTENYVATYTSAEAITFAKNKIVNLTTIDIAGMTLSKRVRTVVLWGDSITNENVKNYLQKILGNDWIVVRGGVPGDTPLGIAGRQGGVPIVINSDITVKYAAETQFEGFSSLWDIDAAIQTTVGKGSQLGSTYWFEYGNCSLLNPCYIKKGDDYIACTITMNDNKYYIKRNTDGEDIAVSAGETIYSYASQHYRDAEVVVSYMGANGGFSSYDALAKMYKAMMAYSTSGQFIAVGFHMGHIVFPSGNERDYWTDDYCSKMTLKFGSKYLDLQSVGARDADYIFEELGISRTSLDDELISQNKWPSSWQTNYINNVHPNGYGSKAIAIMIKQRMQELGYLDY